MSARAPSPAETRLFDTLQSRRPLGVDMTDQAGADPLTEEELQRAVQRLGFEPPALMVRLYRAFGNGGFGMGYGMTGLGGGYRDDNGDTCDELYAEFADGPDNPEGWDWPERLLPFCDFGCAICACIDCTTDSGHVVIWDPNIWEPGQPVAIGLLDTGKSFLDWMQAWADGVDLWNSIYGEGAAPARYVRKTGPQ